MDISDMLAYCGLDCGECPAYIATVNDDDELRKKTAEQWTELYQADIKPSDINCVGCGEEGAHIGHWSKCEIRLCAEDKGVVNCAHCDDYICEQLDEYFKMAPEMKESLEREREKL